MQACLRSLTAARSPACWWPQPLPGEPGALPVAKLQTKVANQGWRGEGRAPGSGCWASPRSSWRSWPPCPGPTRPSAATRTRSSASPRPPPTARCAPAGCPPPTWHQVEYSWAPPREVQVEDGPGELRGVGGLQGCPSQSGWSRPLLLHPAGTHTRGTIADGADGAVVTLPGAWSTACWSPSAAEVTTAHRSRPSRARAGRAPLPDRPSPSPTSPSRTPARRPPGVGPPPPFRATPRRRVPGRLGERRRTRTPRSGTS